MVKKIPAVPLIRNKYGYLHLNAPAIEITTMVGCPLMCTFCPQDTLRTNYGNSTKYLSIENFRKILQKLPSNTRIDFSGMAEPWANPNCTEMLEIALEEGFKVGIYTTLYGMHDAHAVAKLLKNYSRQIEVIMLHLPDANKNMKGWKYSDEWLEAFNIISALNIDCGINCMTMDGTGRIHDDLQGLISDLKGWKGHTRAGSLEAEELDERIVEITPHNNFSLTCASSPFFDRNVLLPNGDIVLCCMDYSLQHILGNLLTQSYWEILNGEEMSRILKLNESPEFSKCSICKSCENVNSIGAGKIVANNAKQLQGLLYKTIKTSHAKIKWFTNNIKL